MAIIAPTADLISGGVQISTGTTPAIIEGGTLYVMQDIDVISLTGSAVFGAKHPELHHYC